VPVTRATANSRLILCICIVYSPLGVFVLFLSVAAIVQSAIFLQLDVYRPNAESPSNAYRD
jgi:hypothetical protein